jgi:hypothetical protein
MYKLQAVMAVLRNKLHAQTELPQGRIDAINKIHKHIKTNALN